MKKTKYLYLAAATIIIASIVLLIIFHTNWIVIISAVSVILAVAVPILYYTIRRSNKIEDDNLCITNATLNNKSMEKFDKERRGMDQRINELTTQRDEQEKYRRERLKKKMDGFKKVESETRQKYENTLSSSELQDEIQKARDNFSREFDKQQPPLDYRKEIGPLSRPSTFKIRV